MNKQDEKQKGIVEVQGTGECKLADEQLGQVAAGLTTLTTNGMLEKSIAEGQQMKGEKGSLIQKM